MWLNNVFTISDLGEDVTARIDIGYQTTSLSIPIELWWRSDYGLFFVRAFSENNIKKNDKQ